MLAGCNDGEGDLSEPGNGLVLGRWELAEDRSREWLDFGEDGTWEAWGDWESPAGESIVGTYVQYGDSVSGTSIYGLEMSLRVRGDTLVLSDGTRYVRAGR
jgi:hypothetical protein